MTSLQSMYYLSMKYLCVFPVLAYSVSAIFPNYCCLITWIIARNTYIYGPKIIHPSSWDFFVIIITFSHASLDRFFHILNCIFVFPYLSYLCVILSGRWQILFHSTVYAAAMHNMTLSRPQPVLIASKKKKKRQVWLLIITSTRKCVNAGTCNQKYPERMQLATVRRVRTCCLLRVEEGYMWPLQQN